MKSLNEAMLNLQQIKRKNLKELKLNEEEEYSYQEIITRMENATSYDELYDAANLIKDDNLRVDVEQLIGECEDDGDDVETAYSIVTSDLLDSKVTDLNEELSDKWKEKLGDNVNNLPEYEFRALRFAEIYGIVDYDVKDNKMVYKETDGGETFTHTVDLDTMKETVNENKLNENTENDSFVVYRNTSEGPLYLSDSTSTTFNLEQAEKYATEQEAKDALAEYKHKVIDYKALSFEVVKLSSIKEDRPKTLTEDEVHASIADVEDLNKAGDSVNRLWDVIVGGESEFLSKYRDDIASICDKLNNILDTANKSRENLPEDLDESKNNSEFYVDKDLLN